MQVVVGKLILFFIIKDYTVLIQELRNCYLPYRGHQVLQYQFIHPSIILHLGIIFNIFLLPLSSEPISVNSIVLIFRLVAWVTGPTKAGLEVKASILPSSFFRIFYQKSPYYLLFFINNEAITLGPVISGYLFFQAWIEYILVLEVGCGGQ